jgi:hypothetical protein
MGIFIPLIIFAALAVIGISWLVVWQIRSKRVEARRWIDKQK